CGSSDAGRGKVSARAGAANRRKKVARRTENRIDTSGPPPPLPRSGSYQSALKRVNQIACFVVLGAACVVCDSGCAPASETPRGLVVALESDPQSVDPRFGIDATSARLADLLHVALTRADASGRRIPDLARAWDWLDDRTLRFRLRDDFRFTNGRAVGGADVRASYEGVLDAAVASPRRATLASLERVEVPDELTVVMHLTAPDAAFLDATSLAIMPADRAREPGETTTGAGPYRLVDAQR